MKEGSYAAVGLEDIITSHTSNKQQQREAKLKGYVFIQQRNILPRRYKIEKLTLMTNFIQKSAKFFNA